MWLSRTRPNTRCLAMARHARNPTVIWGAAAMGHPWPSAAKPASCRFTPQIPIELRPSCLTGRFEIKITITSADQKTADFVSEKDVRATTTADLIVKTARGLMWELACLRWHQLDVPDTPRCLHRRQASSHRKAALQCMQIRSRPQIQNCMRSTVGAGLLPHLDCVASVRDAFASHLIWLLLRT